MVKSRFFSYLFYYVLKIIQWQLKLSWHSNIINKRHFIMLLNRNLWSNQAIDTWIFIISPVLFLKWCSILFTILRSRSTFFENLVKRIIILMQKIHERRGFNQHQMHNMWTKTKQNHYTKYLHIWAPIKFFFIQSILVHHPISSLTTRRSASVEN